MNDRLLITGPGSIICQEFRALLPHGNFYNIGRNECDFSNLDKINEIKELILSCDRILLAHAILSPKQDYKEMTEDEIVKVIKVNLLSTIKIIEIALENPNVRIAVIGSESGLKGSLDVAYGLSKIALHKYIEERKIKHPNQQLVCVAPSLIEDSYLTKKRQDKERVNFAINNNPKKRGLTGKEVACMIYNLLYLDDGYTNNTVIHMNGGKYARS